MQEKKWQYSVSFYEGKYSSSGSKDNSVTVLSETSIPLQPYSYWDAYIMHVLVCVFISITSCTKERCCMMWEAVIASKLTQTILGDEGLTARPTRIFATTQAMTSHILSKREPTLHTKKIYIYTFWIVSLNP